MLNYCIKISGDMTSSDWRKGLSNQTLEFCLLLGSQGIVKIIFELLDRPHLDQFAISVTGLLKLPLPL